MTIDDNIKDEKLQYDKNREAAKVSALSSGRIDKYKYLKYKYLTYISYLISYLILLWEYLLKNKPRQLKAREWMIL